MGAFKIFVILLHCAKKFYQYMWPNPQETADLVTFFKKSLMENFILCAVSENDGELS